MPNDLSHLRIHRVASAPHADALATWLGGASGAIERVRARCVELAQQPGRVIVVHGDVGSGKARAAALIHGLSERAALPLAVVPPTAPETLPEASATGTILVRHFEQARREMTGELLGVATRAGGPTIILSTRTALGELRAAGLESSQLLGLAGRSTVFMPPLRSRPLDVPELARVFLEDAAVRYGRPLRGLSPGAQVRLESHDFPGNVRELRTLIELATLRATGDWITADAFPGVGPGDEPIESGEFLVRLPGSSLREVELRVLRLALRLSRGRVVRTAELLGITRHALRRKLEKHGLLGLRSRGGDVPMSRLHEDTDASYL